MLASMKRDIGLNAVTQYNKIFDCSLKILFTITDCIWGFAVSLAESTGIFINEYTYLCFLPHSQESRHNFS